MSDEQRALQTQIEEAQRNIGGLEEALRARDEELESLSTEREQYELLEQVCGSLEALAEQGAADLFWGKTLVDNEPADHIRGVRRTVEGFQERLEQLERERQSVIEEINDGQEILDILEDDLFEIREEEEQRKLEWLVEREVDALPDRRQVMPWMRVGEEDERFRKSLAASMLLSVLLGLLLPLIDLPIPERAEIIEVPERLVQLIREQRPLPPPPPVPEEPVVADETPEPEPEPELEPEPEPEPILAEELPTELPEEVAEVPTPPAPPEVSSEERVASAGILAFRESFSNLAEGRPSTELGSQARISNSGEAATGRPERSMVAIEGPGSSGGINLSSLSRDVGGGGGDGGPDIEGVRLTRVESSIGSIGGPDRPLSNGAAAGRTDEEIQIVFDRYKAALYRLYNRELRNDPTLRGQIVLRLTIEPDGSVSMCELEASDMNAPELARQVVERVRTFDFGAKENILAITILYPIDFLPAG